MHLPGKVIAITGAAQGLGKAMALYLAQKGAHLALIDMNAEALEQVANACRDFGVKAEAFMANITVEAEVETVFQQIVDKLERLDGLINNAGIIRDGLLVKVKDGQIDSRLSLADWNSVLSVNLTGVFLCGREAATQMIKLGNGGCLINISSISRAGNIGQSNYSATKAGVAALATTWAKELARYGIRAAAIAPGFIATDMTASMKPEIIAKIESGIPAKRMGVPNEIAQTAAFILENDYISGRVIEVDGALRL